MIAIILAGGEGTRLRPLTEWLPKSMLPIANRPFLEHQIDHLRRHGVTRVILSCGYLPDPIRDHFGASLEYAIEPEP
ncbi:MAG: mannose-phosphate guanylyltransferase, partial [Gaiellales bacterium]|nr:mannose-phosphate guanylyltransferase [Gaiellales bacterium]